MASLSCLPTEIQCLIFRLLDPAGLIAASQTNQHFRKVIQPARKHFIERLIQLECDEKEGGIIPHFNPINNALSPGWSEPEWKRMRWACSGCLRLLSEQHFDNHSILRLEYRKPIPDYSTSDCFTTWEPGPRNSPYLSHIRREQQLQSDHFAAKKLMRRRYALALSNRWSDNTWSPRAQEICHELQSCGWTTFENMTSTDFLKLTIQEKKHIFEAEIRAIEAIRCGSKRHLRKCHECRYQSGQLKPTLKGSDGKAKIPFTAGRQYRIPTGIDRYYPRFWEKLRNQRPTNSPPSYAVYRVHVRDRFWAMYMIRCPHCEKWKEERMFPVDYVQPRGDGYSRRTPSKY